MHIYRQKQTTKEYFEVIEGLQREADSWLDTLQEKDYARNKHGEVISRDAETVLMKYREKKAAAE